MGSGFLNTLKDDLVALRHELHGIPELGLNLPHTQARLLRELEGLPLEITTGKDLSSITAVLRGRGAPAGERRTVLLRADMDALPVVERTGLEWASTNGNMHACGHDCHMTCLVGAVRELCERVDELAGEVVFMFQPGEEGEAGAQRMIDEGVLEASGRRVDAAYALHVWSGMDDAGTYHCRPGTIMASSDDLTVIFEGRGGHGSAPPPDPRPGAGGGRVRARSAHHGRPTLQHLRPGRHHRGTPRGRDGPQRHPRGRHRRGHPASILSRGPREALLPHPGGCSRRGPCPRGHRQHQA